MRRRATRARLLRRVGLPAAALVAASLALGACDANFSATAAKVDGAAVSQQTLNDALRAASSDAAFRCIVQASSSGSRVTGSGAGTYSAGFVSAVLSTLVDGKALHARVAPLGLTLGPLAAPVATQVLGELYTPSSGSSSCAQTAQTAISRLGAAYRNDLVTYQEDQDALIARLQGVSLTPEGIAAYARQHPDATSLDCVDAIVVSTKAKATQLAAELARGASFSALAKSNSLDTSSAANGGSIGCVLPAGLSSQLGSAVAALPVGMVSQPVAYSNYWILFQVTSKKPAPAQQVALVVVANGYQKFQKVLNGIVGRAKVEIDPNYGTWEKASGTWQVAPPKGPADHLLLDPGAVTPGSASSLG